VIKKTYIYRVKLTHGKLIAMSSDLESSIRLIEETNNPDNAYFSYSVDDTGEYGLIKANKEGLRLYAADLLKQSLLMEEAEQPEIEQPKPNPLLFAPKEWMFSETGYNLIAGILPQYQSRRNILAEGQYPVRHAPAKEQRKPVLLFVLMCITGALIMLATLKAFPNLRLWVNIR
jgi:hypothetical protein